jgi:hypothetical protein
MLFSLLTAGGFDTGSNLSPVPLTSAGIVDTGGNFATSSNNTSGTRDKICRQCR